MTRAETRVRLPALGASAAGVPVADGGTGAIPAGVGAPPVTAAAGVAEQAETAATNAINPIPVGLRTPPVLLCATYILSFDRLRS